MKRTISVCDLTGPIAVSSEKGELLYQTILPNMEAYSGSDNPWIEISLKDITHLTACFINAAIGPLCHPDKLNTIFLSFIDLSDDDQKLIDLCIKHAKEYHDNPELYTQIVREVMDDLL